MTAAAAADLSRLLRKAKRRTRCEPSGMINMVNRFAGKSETSLKGLKLLSFDAH